MSNLIEFVGVLVRQMEGSIPVVTKVKTYKIDLDQCYYFAQINATNEAITDEIIKDMEHDKKEFLKEYIEFNNAKWYVSVMPNNKGYI